MDLRVDDKFIGGGGGGGSKRESVGSGKSRNEEVAKKEGMTRGIGGY